MAKGPSFSVRLGLDVTKLRAGLKAASAGLKNFSSRMRRLGDGAGAVGRKLTIGLTLPIVAAGAAIVKFGLDAVESENLFEVSMGKMSKQARAFSLGLRKEFGLNDFEIRRQTAVLFEMVRSMGLAEGAAFDVATGLVALSNDMASFRNLRPEDAFNKLTAAISGEAEPLKRIGILVNETTIQQVAWNAGLVEQGKKLNEQEKVLARYLTIVRATAKDQGDLAATIESPTNQLRIMTTQIKLTATELGVALIPTIERVVKIAKEFVKVVRGLAERFTALSPEQQNNIVLFVALAAAIGPILLAVGALIKSVFLISSALSLFASTLAALIGPIGLVILALAGFAILALVIAKNWEALKTVVLNVVNKIIGFFSSFISAAKDFLVEQFVKIFTFWDDILGGALAAIVGWINNTIRFWGEFIKKAKEFLVGKFRGVLNKLIELFNKVGDKIGITIDAIKIGTEKGVKGIESSFISLKDDAVGIFGKMAEGLLAKIKAFSTTAPTIVDEGNEKIKGSFEGIKTTLDALKGTLGADLFDTAQARDSAKTFDSINEKMEKARLTAQLLGETFDGQGMRAGLLREAIVDLIEQGVDPQSASMMRLVEAFRLNAEESTIWKDRLAENLLELGELTTTFIDQFAQGFGDAIAGLIVDGQNLSKAMKTVFKGMARSVISALARIAVQLVINAVAGAAAAKTQGAAQASANLASVFGGQFAAMSQAPYPLNLTAPLVAAAMLAAASAGIGGAAAAGIASFGAAAHGGIVTRPSIGLVGEAGPEAIIPLDRLGEIAVGTQTIMVMLDEEVIAQAAVRGMPDVLRVELGMET